MKNNTKVLESQPNPNPNIDNSESEALVMTPGCSTLCMTRGLKVSEYPPFVCDGSAHCHYIACEKKIKVTGLGFLGPIENDGWYNVKIQIIGMFGIEYESKMLDKRIFAQKGKTFYFAFDEPIDLEAGSVCDWSKCYLIYYYLQGPNTSAVIRSHGTDFLIQEEGDTKFRLQWWSNQLVEILFKSR